MSLPGCGRACLLTLSRERDLQLRLRLAAWREGYRAGRAAGIERGRALEAAEREAAWRAVARPVATGLPYSEMDRRRYPPAGRQGWILPTRR